MTAEAHEGWGNYETWAVALHIDNDRATLATARRLARQCESDESPRVALADELSEWIGSYHIDPVTEEAPAGTPDGSWRLVCDLLSHAVARVDWLELAAHYLAEARRFCPTCGADIIGNDPHEPGCETGGEA